MLGESTKGDGRLTRYLLRVQARESAVPDAKLRPRALSRHKTSYSKSDEIEVGRAMNVKIRQQMRVAGERRGGQGQGQGAQGASKSDQERASGFGICRIASHRRHSAVVLNPPSLSLTIPAFESSKLRSSRRSVM